MLLDLVLSCVGSPVLLRKFEEGHFEGSNTLISVQRLDLRGRRSRKEKAYLDLYGL